MVLQRRFFPNAIAFAAGFLSASLLVVVLLRAGASPLRGSFHGQVSTPPYLEGILEWTGSSSSLTLLEGHPGVSTLERGKEFQWVQTWRVVSTDQLRERAKQQGCDMAHSAVLASFWTDYKNYYHWMQDNALPAFVQYPDAHALRFFAEVDFPKPAGHHMTRHWIPRGVEGLPLRDKDPAMPHCVAIQNMHLMTAKYGLNFSKPGSRLRADSHINNMSGFAQRVAGEQFPLATTPRELRGHEREPVVVRVIQRRAEGRQRNFVELERVLEDTRQRLANREANGGDSLPVDLGVMYFEDFQDDKQALLRHMQSVDVLVGFHGAGMTNMMFMRPCSSVTQVLSPVHCFWLAAEVFEGLAYMRQLPYSELCLSLENTKMYGGEERAEKSQQLAQQVRETGAHPEQQPYLYKIEELYVTPAELESVVRTGLRSNLLCRSMAEE